MTYQPYLLWTLRLMYAAVLLSDFELWSLRKLFRARGFLDLAVKQRKRGRHWSAWVFGTESRYRFITGLVGARICLCLFGIFSADRPAWQRALVPALLLLSFALRRVPRLGNNASDDMLFVVQIVCTIAVYADPLGAALAFFFLSAQLSLAYATAGLSKATQAEWWNGTSVHKVLSSSTFGNRGLYRLICRVPSAQRVGGIATIAGEVLISLAPWIAPRFAVLLLCTAFFFHAGVAAVMGLNTFLPVFLSLYPAALFTSAAIYSPGHPGMPR